MFAVCLRYAQSRPEAEDMLQEGFIKVFRDLPSYKPTGPLGGWIRTVIVHTALEQVRKKRIKTQSSYDNIVPLTGHPKDTPLEDLSAKELIQYISALPEEYRLVFNLYAIEGYSHAEIGEMLEISVANSKVRLSRARSALKRTVEANYSYRSK